nr:hypothetical protein [Tanacetum cinerariifolium]
MVAEDDKMSKDKEIDKLMALKPKRAKDAAYHKENILFCKQEEARFQLNAEQADWKDDTDDEPKNQELEAHYMYMAQIQEVIPDAADNSGHIFDSEPLQKTNQLMYKDLKKFQVELDRHNYVNYASKLESDYAKVKGDLMSYKMEFEKSSNE